MRTSDKEADNVLEKKDVDFEYETPRLIHYGDVRDVTLGGSLGIGESGSTPSDPRRNP
ncbi:MAG: lasso RiPP family leader peptide-containing protein [Gammaproteobacteria bacterium]|nr:lasso RiPP family leader peptide-containing protein [Gammaproteobacteria bacterium]